MQIVLTVDFPDHDMNEDWVRRLGHYLEKSVIASTYGSMLFGSNAHGDHSTPFSVAHIVISWPRASSRLPPGV
jgi:hypothetical protein